MTIQVAHQSVQLLKHENPLMMVEHAARICYDSVDKMQPEKTADFVRNLIKRGHFTPLEHAYVRIHLNAMASGSFKTYIWGLHNFAAPGDYPFADRRLTRGAFYRGIDSMGPFVSGNLRDIMWYIGKHDDPVSFLQSTAATIDPEYVVLEIVTDRGIATEFFRHRTMSYDDDGYEQGYKSLDVDFVPELSVNQQSTRYVNFNRKPVTLIVPEPATWAYDECSDIYQMWYNSCTASIETYSRMIESGITPEYARSVLPLSLGTRAIISGSLMNWLYVLNLRLPKGAHPGARLLGAYIWDVLKENYSEYIKDILSEEKLDQEWEHIDFEQEATNIKNEANAHKGDS